MYRIQQIKLGLDEDLSRIPEKIKKQTGAMVKHWVIVKESIDARKKSDIKRVYTVDFTADRRLNLDPAPDLTYSFPASAAKPPEHTPVIIGFGPCGIFAALILAEAGYRPIVLERGKPVEERARDVEAYWSTGRLNEESNVQFGEGGAGTFSDGKLTTGIRDPRTRKVLEAFVEAGASEEILYKQKPHIGTDVLQKIVVNLRKRIISKGGRVCFNRCVTDFILEDGKVNGVVVNGIDKLVSRHIILAPGHSSRDTLRQLNAIGIPMEQKPFSMGVRIEHPQELINRAQYGDPALAQKLGPADYKLNHRCQSGRGVYTFCMCPGGQVIMAASQQNTMVTNGMSYSRRNGAMANSGLLVDVRVSDFSDGGVLAGMEFQEKYEQLAYQNGRPPKVRWGDFGKANPVADSLPGFVTESICEAMPYLGRKLKGFDDPEAILTGIESRSSSPVRILRNQEMESEISGLYPAGEGAGYAGGIMSAAVDGIRAAERVAAALSHNG